MAAVLGLLALAAPAAAQQDANLVRRLDRQLREIDRQRLVISQDQPISERLVLDYGGSVRFGIFAIDDEFGSTRILRQTDASVYLRAELEGAHRLFTRARLLYNDFNSGDSFDGRGDDLAEPIVDRWWYQFDLRSAALAQTGERIDHNVNVKVGRQFVYWTTGLSLNTPLYAGLASVELGDIELTGLAGQTPGSSTIDFDGSRPDFDRNTERAYYGGKLAYLGWRNHQPFFSFLAQRDENDNDFTVFDLGGLAFPTRFNYDSEYWSIGSRGAIGPQITYQFEVVYQTGRALSNSFDADTLLPIRQTREDIEAWAGRIRATYLLRDERDTRFDVEFMGASGDDDRLDASDTFGGNRAGTTDRGFNGLGYANTGLALAPELSNLLALRAGWSTSLRTVNPDGDWLRVGVSAFLFAKSDQSAPLTFRTSDATFVGGEIDFAADWRIRSDLSFTIRYGIFLPGDAMPEDEDGVRHFGYAGVTYGF